MARRYTASDAIKVEGLNDFRNQLKALNNGKLTRELSKLHYDVSETLAVATKLRMSGSGRWLDNEAAKGVQAQRRVDGGQIALMPITLPKGRIIPATGVEFGAYQNRRRLIKDTGGRATIVRDEEDLSTVIGNVERQYVNERGSISKRGGGGRNVKVLRVVKGWNQFQPWRGNKQGAGYYLFPALRDMQPQLTEMYLDGVNGIYGKAFPDRDAANRSAA